MSSEKDANTAVPDGEKYATDKHTENGVVDAQGQSPTISEQKKGNGGMKSFFRIFKYASTTDKIFYAVGTVSSIGAGTALPLMSIVFGGFVTEFTKFGAGLLTGDEIMDAIEKLTLWFVYLFIGKFVLTYISATLFTLGALRITKEIRSQFVKATFRQEIAFFDNVGPGSIAVRATTNATHINAGIAEKFARLFQSMSMIVTALIVGLTRSWRLSLIITAAVFPLFVILSLTMTYEAVIEEGVNRIYSKASNLAEEILGSIKTVRAFEASPTLLKKYDKLLTQANKEGSKKSMVWGVMFGADFFFAYMPFALAFWEGSRMYLRGDLDSVGRLTTVVFSILLIAAAIAQIAPSTTTFVQAAASASDLFETLDRVPLFDATADSGLKPESTTGNVTLRNVSFAYPSRPHIPILKKVSLEIPANKTTALVGASGSGKSTIIALLERWYDASDGEILVHGHEIKDLNVKWLRSSMKLVQQEPVLFNNTIYHNIVQGLTNTEYEHASDDVKMKLVKDACKAANASDFIEELEEGYQTLVGERAGLLSGGQKQRIAIARAVISDPKILLLDEATSALDAHSEGIVQNALDRVSKSRTTIVIAHKLATVMKADNIIVLGQGEVLEQGTHQSLLEKQGAYARLVNAQNLDGDQRHREKDDTNDGASESTDDILGEPLGNKLVTTKSWASRGETSNAYQELSLMKAVVKLLLENKHMWKWYSAIFLFSFIGGGVYPANAVLLSNIIVAFELDRDLIQDRVNLLAGLFMVLATVALISYVILGWSANVIAQTLTKRYRLEMLESLLRQDISFFDAPENASATLASKLSTSPSGLQELVGMNICLMLIVVINLISNFVLAMCYGWKLTLVIFFGAFPLIFGAGFYRIRLEMQFDEKVSAPFADSARFASEAVGAMRTVVSFTIEDSISADYDARLDRSLQKAIKFTLRSMIFWSLSESLQFLGMALAFWYGGKLISTREYTTSQFFVIYVAIIFGGEAAAQFFAWTGDFVKAHAGANYILKLRHSQAEISTIPDAKKPNPDGEYSFDKVHFRYPLRRNVPVLQGLDLKIKAGSSVAFVGGSGCGKSTTIGLLERYYDPAYGSLNFDSTPLPDLHLHNYRSNISLVSQEPTLYQGTIDENIRLGAAGSGESTEQEITEEQVIKAAKEANIYDFVMSLPEGFGTECGSRGMQLSGGQKQRIAIARALARDPKIMLLDEATSALDTTSEKLVQESLNNAAKGRTTISVAHRLSTIRDCDRIFVFDGGKIAEAGTHLELLALNGRYKKLCEAQSLDREA